MNVSRCPICGEIPRTFVSKDEGKYTVETKCEGKLSRESYHILSFKTVDYDYDMAMAKTNEKWNFFASICRGKS
jgi:hypothetical protein